MPGKYMQIKSSILYCELVPLTRDVTCSKLQRYLENISDKKLSVEHTACTEFVTLCKLDLSEEMLKTLMYLQENLYGKSFLSIQFQIQSLSKQFCLSRTPPESLHRMISARQLFSRFRKIFCEISLPFFFEQSCRPPIFRLQLN